MKQIALLLLVGLLTRSSIADEHSFHHENLLGTSGEFLVVAASPTDAANAEQEMLKEIDRLSNLLNTYHQDSEVSRWQRGEIGSAVSEDLFAVLLASDVYERQTEGAFNPRVTQLSHEWKSAAELQRLPSAARLTELTATIREPFRRLDVHDKSAQWIGGSHSVTLDAIAKGYIIDRAAQVALRAPGVTGVMVNIGGDLRVAGDLEQNVSIAEPENPSAILETIEVTDQAVATSGGYHRFFEIDGIKYSHLIDPHDGQSVTHTQSVSVLATTAMAADATATALSVMPIREALLWCENHEGFECLIVDANGSVHRSSAWPSRHFTSEQDLLDEESPALIGDEDEWPEGAKMTVEFEFNRAGSRRYRRPYVAVWVENEDGFPVKTLALWLMEGKGSRWHRDLRRWYKQERLRQDSEEGHLIGTISEATRPPGKYKVVWDGKDNQGQIVKQGTYTLYIESAREHGPYELTKATVVVGLEDQKGEHEGKEDLKSATFEYKK